MSEDFGASFSSGRNIGIGAEGSPKIGTLPAFR